MITILIVKTGLTLRAQAQSTLMPLVVLIEHNPWLNSINSDEPTVAIYKNGLVIYRVVNDKNQCTFFYVQLSRKGLDSLKTSLNLKYDSLYLLPDHIDPYKNRGITIQEQPNNELYLFTKKKTKRVSIYGELSSPTVLKELPKYLANLVRKIKNYESHNATLWMPAKIELMLWPKDNAVKTIAWPQNWPGFADCLPNIKHHTSYTYSLYLDARHESALQTLLSSLNDDEAILMDGHKWVILYRYPMPAEALWR